MIAALNRRSQIDLNKTKRTSTQIIKFPEKEIMQLTSKQHKTLFTLSLKLSSAPAPSEPFPAEKAALHKFEISLILSQSLPDSAFVNLLSLSQRSLKWAAAYYVLSRSAQHASRWSEWWLLQQLWHSVISFIKKNNKNASTLNVTNLRDSCLLLLNICNEAGACSYYSGVKVSSCFTRQAVSPQG